MKLEWTTDHRHWYRTVYLKSEHWSNLRHTKLRANPDCQKCGCSENLDVHHVNYRNLFDVSVSDLLTLCRPCHNRQHEIEGAPVRRKVSYKNYFPQQVKDKIEEQKQPKPPKPPKKKVWAKYKTCSYERWEATRFVLRRPTQPKLISLPNLSTST